MNPSLSFIVSQEGAETVAWGVAVRQAQGVGDELIKSPTRPGILNIFYLAVPPTLLPTSCGQTTLRVTAQVIFLFYT